MRRLIAALIAATVAVTLLLSATGPATAADSFRFHGSGNGHGLGMSQWGAEGLAELGWGHRKILRHYYSGTAVGTGDDLPERIRVGLTEGRRVVHLTAKAGPVRVWVGKAKSGTLAGTITRGRTWTVTAKAGDYLIKTDDGQTVGGRRWGSPTQHIFLTYADQGGRVFVPEADAIWGKGFTYARGTLELNLYACGTPCSLRMIARLDFEEYLLGLGEVPPTWPMQALKAQAVAARSFAAYVLGRYGLRASCNCDLTDGANDQVYAGWGREAGEDGARWAEAVRSTAHVVVTYGGEVIQAFYSASNGGHSESVEDVWHGGDPRFAIPWLTGVCDPGEFVSGNPWLDWGSTFSVASVTGRLAPYTGAIGTVTGFAKAERGSSGRIVSILVRGAAGSDRISGSQLRSAFGLPDTRVWINSDRTIEGAIRARYDELGCAPGLPVSPHSDVIGGSQQLFQDGGLYRNAARDLTVWLRGKMDREYRAVDAAKGPLGVPTSTVRALGSQARTRCVDCSRIRFVGGRIYASPATGAHALWGPVLDRYLEDGGVGGSLGSPTSRTRRTPAGGWKANFEHGRIVCGPGATCSIVPT